jgi:hypothetical protein
MSAEIDPKPTKETIAKGEKTFTSEDFVTSWPLYTPFKSDGFRPPGRISFHCEQCGKETTWDRMNDPDYQSIERLEEGFYWIYYLCDLCRKRCLIVMYRVMETEERLKSSTSPLPSKVSVVTKVQKIGQFPALSVNIPKSLEKNLGEASKNLYKKALISRNEGYGLAAVTYIRRVVEDKTDELIEVVAQLAESHNIGPEIVQQIRAAKNERTTYENKLRIAATVLPDSLVVDGANPLGVLYGLVSEGVHDLTEEQCIAVADETKSVFEFTFTHLRAETKIRQDFVAKVKKLAGAKGPSQKENQN